MFVLFFLPFRIRNSPLNYEWVFYKALSAFGETTVGVIGNEEYFGNLEVKVVDGTWGTQLSVMSRFGYELPTQERIDAVPKYVVNSALFNPLEQKLRGPNLTWSHLIRERHEGLEREIEAGLRHLSAVEPIEAIVQWANCASVTHVARKLGIHLIHNELGPLRAPEHRNTAYFDRRGVNGQTEAADRFAAFSDQRCKVEILALPEIRTLLGTKEIIDCSEFEIGVALQVPDDSNTLAFGEGFTNTEVLALATRHWGDEQVLVRPHPGSKETLRTGTYPLDQSETVAGFLSRVDGVLSINSSVGLEAMLHGKRAYVVGDSPMALGATPLGGRADTRLDADRLRWINFFVLGYLLPYELLFSPEYYRWRLTDPSEQEIFERHLAWWRGGMSRSPATSEPTG